ncbi:serine hydrolase domain-containing protein [Arthrobacter sp. KNU40]|uniref:serine hydrolase domain-containing protein n=1 Tax=Arthrobacter sp. KNU40 TaxID=3447965 RepID=UPI003F5FDBC9
MSDAMNETTYRPTVDWKSSLVPEGITLDNWQSQPNLRWSFQHVADILPTATISRGRGPVANLPEAPTDLSTIHVPEAPGGSHRTVADIIRDTETDGWMVLHRGRVLVEEYFGNMGPESSHLLMSVSKSLVGAVVGALTDSGAIDPDQPLTAYVPPLAETGYAGATVRQLLDMRSGIHFSEDYLDPNAEVRKLEEAIGWATHTGPPAPTTMYGFLLTLKQKAPHGGPFEYRSCETDMLGWICEAATGMRMPELMSQTLWAKLGAESDATIGIDSNGTGMFDGGINAGLRDMVRFGSLFLNGGTALTGEQILTPAWINDTFDGGHDSRAAFAASPGDNRMPGGMYRNQMWFPYPDNNVTLCLGIHGQMIYINRAADIIAAKLSSWPLPQDATKLFPTVHAFDAIADAVI